MRVVVVDDWCDCLLRWLERLGCLVFIILVNLRYESSSSRWLKHDAITWCDCLMRCSGVWCFSLDVHAWCVNSRRWRLDVIAWYDCLMWLLDTIAWCDCLTRLLDRLGCLVFFVRVHCRYESSSRWLKLGAITWYDCLIDVEVFGGFRNSSIFDMRLTWCSEIICRRPIFVWPNPRHMQQHRLATQE